MPVQMSGAVKQLALVDTYVDRDLLVTRVRDSLKLTPSWGAIWYRSVDIGWPDTRASVQDRPGSDGTLDQTQYTGARVVSVDGVVLQNAFEGAPAVNSWPSDIGWNSASYWCAVLAAWCAPARRVRLYLTNDSGVARFMDIRGDSFTSEYVKESGGYREFNAQWVCPSGKLYEFATGEDATDDGRHLATIVPQRASIAGRVYPELGPYLRDYPAAGIGSTSVQYRGTVPNGFEMRLIAGSSALIGPQVTVTAPDGTTSVIGISSAAAAQIQAGGMLIIDTVNRTVVMRSGGADQNWAQYLTAPLTWPVLRPGINRNLDPSSPLAQRGYNAFAFVASSSPASDSFIEVRWYNADLH